MMSLFHTYIIQASRRLVPLLLVLLCLPVLLSSCERRPLEDEGGVTALVPFQIDWSKSGLDVSKMNSASIWFFPQDGTSSFEWRLQGDLTTATVPLAAGKYSLVVFNETIDDTDWNSLAFEGQAKYETFHVYATTGTFTGLYGRASESDIRDTPEAIASWSMDKFEVTPEMIDYTRGRTSRSSGSETMSQSLDALATITPLPLTVGVHILATVINLKSAARCSAALEGATGKMSLATGRPVRGQVTHVLKMNNRKYNPASPFDGTIEASFLLFKLQEEAINYGLQLDFDLIDGTKMPPDHFNITDQIDKDTATIEVEIGVVESEPEKDHPIKLPQINIDNVVDIDEWEDYEIGIK